MRTREQRAAAAVELLNKSACGGRSFDAEINRNEQKRQSCLFAEEGSCLEKEQREDKDGSNRCKDSRILLWRKTGSR